MIVVKFNRSAFDFVGKRVKTATFTEFDCIIKNRMHFYHVIFIFDRYCVFPSNNNMIHIAVS